ncbi:hypothetical protein BaRGS_00034615 [Batillaria attramentaria]|uniref:Uncharacterized protein n=1 Tax=Batillaria attramentaria TaxID=370345 RepID=A0ABD0JGW4_9CAEN
MMDDDGPFRNGLRRIDKLLTLLGLQSKKLDTCPTAKVDGCPNDYPFNAESYFEHHLCDQTFLNLRPAARIKPGQLPDIFLAMNQE